MMPLPGLPIRHAATDAASWIRQYAAATADAIAASRRRRQPPAPRWLASHWLRRAALFNNTPTPFRQPLRHAGIADCRHCRHYAIELMIFVITPPLITITLPLMPPLASR
jgi:hypothetical protein